MLPPEINLSDGYPFVGSHCWRSCRSGLTHTVVPELLGNARRDGAVNRPDQSGIRGRVRRRKHLCLHGFRQDIGRILEGNELPTFNLAMMLLEKPIMDNISGSEVPRPEPRC